MARETNSETTREVAAEMASQVRDQEDRDVMDDTKLKLYEAQLFNFTPATCMMRICGAFHDSLYEILLAMEKVFVRWTAKDTELGGEEECLQRARECSQKLQQFLEKRFERIVERMTTALMENCLKIPPNVLLAEDQHHRENPQDLQEVLRLESSIAELHRAYEAEVRSRQALLEELEEQKETQELLDGILKWMEETTKMSKDGTGRFQDGIQQVKEAVKKLEDCLAEIYHKAPHSVFQEAQNKESIG